MTTRIKSNNYFNAVLKSGCIFLLVFFSLRYFEWKLFSYFYGYENGFMNNVSENYLALKQESEFRRNVYSKHYRGISNSYGINCLKVIKSDKNEINKSRELMENSSYVKANLSANFYLNITKHCSTFLYNRSYINHSLSDDELSFPLAFSILTYTEIEFTERLLRSIYRPHNFYCIHMDKKMSRIEKDALRSIANCLTNVFIANELIDVRWGGLSLLEAELSCMRTLWPYKDWKYYMNLAGQEFPLKTNRQIVAILKELKGANVVGASAKRYILIIYSFLHNCSFCSPNKLFHCKNELMAV